MDADTNNALDQTAGATAAHRLMLEKLFAMLCEGTSDAIQSAKILETEMLRQFELPSAYNDKQTMQNFAIKQAALEHIELFWRDVELWLLSSR